VTAQRKSPTDVSNGAIASMKFCLAFQREALSVPVTRRVLGDILRTVGVGADSISDLLLAATEACSNVLRHGGPRATGYAVMVSIDATRCEVEVAEDWSFAADRTGEPVRRPAGLSGRRLPRPPAGLTMEGGRRRSRQAVIRPLSGRMPWRGGAPAAGPAQNRGESRRAAREADVAGLAESGRGLDIMRACVDDVTLRSRPGRGTVVTMRKRINWSSDTPLARMRAVG